MSIGWSETTGLTPGQLPRVSEGSRTNSDPSFMSIEEAAAMGVPEVLLKGEIDQESYKGDSPEPETDQAAPDVGAVASSPSNAAASASTVAGVDPSHGRTKNAIKNGTLHTSYIDTGIEMCPKWARNPGPY